MENIQKFGKDFKERVEHALQKLREGKGILLTDDESRENEGDIIFPASTITEKDMAMMIRECSGIVCLCLTEEKGKSLDLRPMLEHNMSHNKTAFTITIEARDGITTGVSAKDRITTVRAAAAAQATPESILSPGHVFPLIARHNGVLERRGHTEGSVDLVRLAGLGNEAVLCELTNEDGTMARMPEVIRFAERHDMTVVTIDDIAQYRQMIQQN